MVFRSMRGVVARPIKRSIVANLETPLAQKGLRGEFSDGDTDSQPNICPATRVRLLPGMVHLTAELACRSRSMLTRHLGMRCFCWNKDCLPWFLQVY